MVLLTQQSPRNNQRLLGLSVLALWCLGFAVSTGCVGCEETITAADCEGDQYWDEERGDCLSIPGGADAGGDAWQGPNSSPGTDGGQTNDNDEEPPCVNLACDQVNCPSDQPLTSLTGTVTVPAGDLPLPNVSVYVPNSSLQPIAQGASCERCEDMVTGDPLVHTTTNTQGYFFLEDVPAGDNIPLVIQTGKWRRKVTLDHVDACRDNVVSAEKTRLPRNQNEGEIPQIAITTGFCDALECLLYRVGLDPEEFSTNTDPGTGSVHMFTGGSGNVGWSNIPGGTNRFDNSFPAGGQNFPDASSWWTDINKLDNYDVLLHNCECTQFPEQKSQAAHDALEAFADKGGRVFMSHWQNTWLEHGNPSFQSVANWRSNNALGFETMTNAHIDTNFAAGQRLHEWMNHVDGLNASGGVDIHEGRITVQSIDSSLAERWLYLPYQGTDWDHYFAFNTPVGASEHLECGRVVFSDLHVAAGNQSSPDHPFPVGCTTGDLTAQEKALVYMLFDLSACITDCVPLRCQDISGACGLEPDGCGSHIECDECCVDLDEPCTVDDDCCSPLWCDQQSGTCTDRCRNPGDPCTSSAQCCSQVCDPTAGDSGECIEQ